MLRRFAALLLLGCGAFGGSLLAWAGSPVTLTANSGEVNLQSAVDYLDDPSGQLDFTALRDRQFQPLPAGRGDSINLGYRQGAAWLRLIVAPTADAPADWFMVVGYPSLDRVDVYLPQAAGLVTAHAGDRNPHGRNAYPHHLLTFPLKLSPGVEQVIYLRVQSSGNLTIPLSLWQPDALARADRYEYARHAAYFGALLALLLYNLLLFLSVRDPLYLLYVGMVAGMGVGQLSLNGFGNLWLWPDAGAWGHWALPLGFAICGLAGAMFTRRFLDTPRYAPRLDRVIVLAQGVFAVLTLAGALLPYSWCAIGVSMAGLGFSILAVGVGIKTWLAGSPGARYFLLAWTLLLTGVAAMAARNMGWLPTNWWTLNLMQIGSALEMLLLSFALADRINILQRDKSAAQAEAMHAKEAVLDSLRHNEVELEARVLERTEALSQANHRLRASEEKMRQLATHDALTGLANRQLLDDVLEHALARARRSQAKLGVAFVDLNGFKAINDRYGHDVGDQVLLAVASRLIGQVRAGDLVARLGGDEFVLVLEQVGAREDLARRARDIHASLALPLPLADHALTVTGSIGTSLFPDDGETGAELLRRADEAMYRQKKRVV